MKCFYHSSDLDGHCSGAIIKMAHPEVELIGINYGQDFPWDKIRLGEIVFMVDFTLQPFEQMERLSAMCDFVWIDHHKTEVEEAKKRNFNPKGLRRIGIGACALVWEYLFKTDANIPSAVKLLAEYDVWNHSNSNTLPFQYGFRFFENTYPENIELWKQFIESDERVQSVIEIGKTLLSYEENQNSKFCKAYSFETHLDVFDDGRNIGQRLSAICCNRGFTNSKLFDSVWDSSKYDIMIAFVRLKLPAKKWTVSLYSTKPDIDCGRIARYFGGGGHVGAAGFQCENLPFEF